MSNLVTEIKRALLKAAANEEPSAEIVEREDILDMMVNELLMPSGRMPQETTLDALSQACIIAPNARALPHDEIRSIIEKVKQDYASGNTPAQRRKPAPRPGM